VENTKELNSYRLETCTVPSDMTGVLMAVHQAMLCASFDDVLGSYDELCIIVRA
jgi:hypothetical protein